MISRRDDEEVNFTLRRNNKEISYFFASRRAGEFWQTSLLLVVAVAQGYRFLLASRILPKFTPLN